MTILSGMTGPAQSSEPAERFASFEEFWPFYLGEHTKPLCRWFHYAGTILALGAAVAACALHPVWLLAAPFAAYGTAWISHFVIERNRPATWSYVWWSVIADFRMFRLAATGRLRAEFARRGVDFDGDDA